MLMSLNSLRLLAVYLLPAEVWSSHTRWMVDSHVLGPALTLVYNAQFFGLSLVSFWVHVFSAYCKKDDIALLLLLESVPLPWTFRFP